MTKESCETCMYWHTLDPNTESVLNRGLCGALKKGDSPFWSKDVWRATLSWEGQNCETYVRTYVEEIKRRRIIIYSSTPVPRVSRG